MEPISRKSILFVCLGNICRSPAADGIFSSLVAAAGWNDRFTIDSAGTYGGHAGSLPDARMRKHAARRGYELTHRSRRVVVDDFERFDLIVAMDDNNYHDLLALAPSPEGQSKVVRMINYCQPTPYTYIPDPYYEGASGFELVLDLLERGCRELLVEMGGEGMARG